MAQVAEATRGFDVREDTLALETGSELKLRLMLKSDSADRATRLKAAAASTLRRLSAWNGPIPHAELIIVDTRWKDAMAGASYPGLAIVSARWLQPDSDRGLERAVTLGVARQFWPLPPGAGDELRQLTEGLVLYTGVRAIHEELEGRHFATTRFFGGFVPHTSRPLLWSPSPIDPRPRIRHFAEVDQAPEAGWRAWSAARQGPAQRVALALHTLERFLGWPAMQQALATLQVRWRAGDVRASDLVAIISEQRGTDMQWFFDEALRPGARFDYGIASFSSEPQPHMPAEFQTRISLRRFGNGVFAGTSAPRGPLQSARSLKVLTRFEDGTAIEEWWDGRDAALEFVYAGPSRAVSSSVDPEAVLLLDEDRSNNTRVTRAEMTPTGARLTASWLIWLQDVMLLSSALL